MPTTIIRAEPGQPWPEPPHGGSWTRDPDTGDLTLVESTSDTDADRLQRRQEQRAAALAAGANQE